MNKKGHNWFASYGDVKRLKADLRCIFLINCIEKFKQSLPGESFDFSHHTKIIVDDCFIHIDSKISRMRISMKETSF